MAKHLQRGAGGHLLRESGGHLANECAAVTCADCEGHGPITATITTAGACDCGVDQCDNDVVSLDWDGSEPRPGWSDDGGSTNWLVDVWCDADVWHISVVGGCATADPSVWEKTFTPSGCVTDSGNGYPTHAGIDMGAPTADECAGTCVPTVALS